MEQKLKEYLEKHNVPYVEHKHPAVFTVEESRKIKQKIPGLQTKCLFLKGSDSRFYLVCLRGSKRLDIKSLRKTLNLKKLNFASPEELKRELNLTPGSVSIFGMINATSVILIIDEELWKAEKIGFHPNINTSTLEINHEALANFLDSLSAEKKIIKLE